MHKLLYLFGLINGQNKSFKENRLLNKQAGGNSQPGREVQREGVEKSVGTKTEDFLANYPTPKKIENAISELKPFKVEASNLRDEGSYMTGLKEAFKKTLSGKVFSKKQLKENPSWTDKFADDMAASFVERVLRNEAMHNELEKHNDAKYLQFSKSDLAENSLKLNILDKKGKMIMDNAGQEVSMDFSVSSPAYEQYVSARSEVVGRSVEERQKTGETGGLVQLADAGATPSAGAEPSRPTGKKDRVVAQKDKAAPKKTEEATSGEPTEKQEGIPAKEEKGEKKPGKKETTSKEPENETEEKKEKDPEKIKTTAEEAISKALTEGEDVMAVIQTLNEVGKELKKSLAGKPEFQTIEFSTPGGGETITWNYTEPENGGFEKTYPLIDKILEIKKIILKGKPEEYKAFFDRSRTKDFERRTELARDAESEEALANIDVLSTKAYLMDPRLAGKRKGEETISESKKEAKIDREWTNYIGHGRIDDIMVGYPFGVFPHQTRTMAAKLITEDRDDRIYLEDIFKFMGGFPEVTKYFGTLIPQDLLADSEDFVEQYKKLKEKTTRSKIEEKQFVEMGNILKACFALLEAFSKLKYPEHGFALGAPTFDQQLEAGLKEGQKEVVAKLKPLFLYGGDGGSLWGTIAGTANEITMSSADGTTFMVDEGTFRRHFNPESAMIGFLEDPQHNTLEGGLKVINQETVIADINKILERGKTQLMLNAVLNPAFAKEKLQGEFKIKTLDDIAKLQEVELQAFQLGFVNEEISQFDQSVKEAAELIDKDTPPLIKEMLEAAAKAGLPKRQLENFRHAMLGMAGIWLHDYGKGGGYEVTGAGIGKSVDLGEGFTLNLGIGADFHSGNPVLGVGLDITIVNTKGFKFTFQTGFAIQGGTAGLEVSTDRLFGVKDLEGSLGVFFGFSWTNIMESGVGVKASISWDKIIIRKREETLTEQAKKDSGVKELWDKWEEIGNEEKWKLIEKLPVYKQIKALMKKYPDTLTKDAVIMSIGQYIEQFKKERVYDQIRAGLTPSGIGVSVVIGVPLLVGAAFQPWLIPLLVIGCIKFQIGSVTISIPMPREESKILSQISDVRMKEKVQKLFQDMRDGKVEMVYEERTPDIYFRPGSTLGRGVRIKEEKYDLSGIAGGVEEYNKALSGSRVRLRKTSATGTETELIIEDPKSKDIEVHIDPALSRMGLVFSESDGRIFLPVTPNDLIITRERFKFPGALASSNACIRDVITIRQKESIIGGRDRTWIEDHETMYLERTMAQGRFVVQPGISSGFSPQSNFILIKSYTPGGELPEQTKKAIEYYKGFESADQGGFTPAEVTAMQHDISNMHGALGGLLENEYQKEIRPDFYKKLDELYADEAFKKEFTKENTLSNPDKMVEVITEYGDKYGLGNLSPKEIDMAVSYLVETWFTHLPEHKKGTLDEKERKAINKKLIERIKLVRAWSEKTYLAKFKKVISRLGDKIKSTPEEMVEKLSADTYAKILEELAKEPPKDYREIIKLGKEGLEAGDTLLSATRGIEGGKKTRAVDVVFNFESPTTKDLEQGHGFIEGTIKGYDLKDTGVRGDIARALLEIASPIPKEDLDLLKSPLALKILGLGAYRIIVEAQENGAKDYEALKRLVTNPSILSDPSSPYYKESKEAMGKFRKFIEQVRAAEISGTKIEIRTRQGVLIVIDMSETRVKVGAYSKCSNLSAAIHEGGKIAIYKKGGVSGVMQIQNEVLDVELGKAMVSASILGGFSASKVEEEEETPPTPPQPRKPHEEGPVGEGRKYQEDENFGRPTGEIPDITPNAGQDGEIPQI